MASNQRLVGPRSTWHQIAHDVGRAVEAHPGPVTFVIGAGASDSSGAPTTKVVDSAFAKRTKLRWPEKTVKEVLHHLSEEEKYEAIRPLFEGLSPYIGYRCLAALGRSRRVYVLNFNWDPLMRNACESLGLGDQVVSFDAERPMTQAEIDRLLPPDRGVVICHLHGLLGERCAYEDLATLRFDDATEELIRSMFFAHPRVFVGTSLIGDFDITKLLWEDDGSTNSPPTWFFGRGDPTSSAATELHELLPRRAVCINDDVYFDQLAVIVLGHVAGLTWDDFRKGRPAVPLPAFAQLIWPRPKIISPIYDAQIGAIVGATQDGKSTVAHFIAYLRLLWDYDVIDELCTFNGETAAAALASLAPDASGTFVLEDIFGTDTYPDANPTLLDELKRIEQEVPKVIVILTSRLGRWQEEIGADPPSFVATSLDGAWYTKKRLKIFASEVAAKNGNELLRDRLHSEIDMGELISPAQIADNLNGVRRQKGTEAAEERLGVLTRHPDLAKLCAFVRLAEFHPDPVTERSVEPLLAKAFPDVPFAKAFLHRFEFEGEQRLRFAHAEDREATDRYLEKMRSLDEIAQFVGLYAATELEGGLSRWHAVRAAARRDHDALREVPSETIADVAGEILRFGWDDDELLALINDASYDSWSRADMAVEFVRYWPRLRERPLGKQMLARMLDAERGTYALLEACLYHGNTEFGELWAKVQERLWVLRDAALLAGHDAPAARREIALIVDAFLWRPPKDSAHVRDWLRNVEELFHEETAEWGMWRFVRAYHASGAEDLISPDVFHRDEAIGWSDEQAEFAQWLLEWHFVHQSHARTLLAKRPWLDIDYLSRTSLPKLSTEGAAAAQRLIVSLARNRLTAPWAAHAACDLRSNPSAPPVSDQALEWARRAVREAPPGHPGIVTTALTYESADEFTEDLQEYFSNDEARDALLDALAVGLEIDDCRVALPRFLFSGNPQDIYEICGIRFPRLQSAVLRAGLDQRDLVRAVMREVSKHVRDFLDVGIERSRMQSVLQRGWRGDLRYFEYGAAARGADPFRAALARALEMTPEAE